MRAVGDPGTGRAGPAAPAARSLMTVMECLVPGRGQGVVMVLTAPLSFWGGVTADGVIADRRHPQRGGCVAERILVLPPSKGSSSSSSVLAELIRAGQGPVGLIIPHPDPIIVVGVLAANELYAADVPVVRGADPA